ncbi:MAG: hypothetical protein GY810_30305 [Aureispira sp.]|nr:hypothetical protein [Aureispira sp.]
MKLLPLLLLFCTTSFAQTTIKDAQKKIVGYWEFQKSDNQVYNSFEELVFYADGKYVGGDQQMMCQGSWTIQNIEKKGLALTMTSSKACGAEQQTLLIVSLSQDRLKFQHPSQESDITFLRQNKKPWNKAKMLKEVLGVWEMPSRREDNKKMVVSLILQKDSFHMFDGGGPIIGPWDLSQDGRYLILKFADEPMVSIYAAAPGHFILPLSQREHKWTAQMEKHTISKPKNGTTAKKVRKKILGTWTVTNGRQTLKQEFRKDNTTVFSISKNKKEEHSLTLNWKVSEEGKYIIIKNSSKTRKRFDLRLLSKDKNGNLLIQEGRTTYSKLVKTEPLSSTTTITDLQKKIVGYWEFQNHSTEELILYDNGNYILGDKSMMCQGSWAIQNSKEKGFILSIVSNKACGSEEQSFRITSLSKDKLKLQSPYQDSDIILLRQTKKPWNKAKMLKEVLGVWDMTPPEENLVGVEKMHSDEEGTKRMRIPLILQKDSFYMFDGGGPIVGPWELSQDGRYLILKFADEPIVSIYAAAPGHFILPLSQKEGKWAAQMEKHTISKAKNGSIAKKLRKKIVGTWEAADSKLGFRQEFKKDGSAVFSILEGTEVLGNTNLNWKISEEGKYILVTVPESKKKSFELRLISKDKKGKIHIMEGRMSYTKTK